MIERVVSDTSTLIGAVLRTGSTPHRALMHALDFCTVSRNESVLTELTEVLNRDRFDRYLSRSDREKFLALIRERTKLFWLDEKDVKDIEPPAATKTITSFSRSQSLLRQISS